MEINSRIRLVDTTLRDGEQAPGVCFSPEIKAEILKILYQAGIRDFEIGTPIVNTDEQLAIKKMLALNLDANLSVWCRACFEDLELAHSLGAKMVNLSLPVSLIQLEAIGKDYDWALTQLFECLLYANDHFDIIAVGAQDGSRAETDFLDKYIKTAISFNKVKRIRMADTVGILNPFQVYDLFKQLSADFPDVEFEFHGHNDLGMANANALAAIKGGAQLVSGTLNGLGERCGNTPIEELLIALEYSEGIRLDIDKRKLRVACSLVEEASGRKIYQSKPFNGEMCFTHESGIHTRSLLVNELTYQPFKAEDTGGTIRFIHGKHSGSAAIKSVLSAGNLPISNVKFKILLAEIKKHSRFSSAGLSSNDVLKLYHKLFKDEEYLVKSIERSEQLFFSI